MVRWIGNSQRLGCGNCVSCALEEEGKVLQVNALGSSTLGGVYEDQVPEERNRGQLSVFNSDSVAPLHGAVASSGKKEE